MPPPLPRRKLRDDAFRRERIRQVEAALLADAGNDREGMVALDMHGTIVFTKIGGRDEIVFTRDEIEMMAGRVDLVTHNHDDGSAFSIEDVAFATALDARELNVFGRDVRWRLVRGAAAWPSQRSVSAAFNRADRQVQRELFRQKRAGVFAGNPFSWADRSGYVWQQLEREHAEWFIVVREDRFP